MSSYGVMNINAFSFGKGPVQKVILYRINRYEDDEFIKISCFMSGIDGPGIYKLYWSEYERI
jgi:hypothetical protein